MPTDLPYLNMKSAIQNTNNTKKFHKLSKLKVYGLAGAVLGGVITLSGCATKPVYQSNQNTQTNTIQVNANGVPNYYQVKAGDTVSQIARRYGLNYRQVGAINQLDSRYTIYKGQWLKLWENGSNTNPNNNPINNPTPNNPYPNQPIPSNPQPNFDTPKNLGQGYTYPTRNRVVKNFDARTGVDSMWFSGSVGDPVLASKGGEVLYSGKGLTEYGNLVMIRHDEVYITVYAHNNQLLVKEGDIVKTGQKIATMGNTGQIDQVALQFQVRKDGVPIDPKLVLGR